MPHTTSGIVTYRSIVAVAVVLVAPQIYDLNTAGIVQILSSTLALTQCCSVSLCGTARGHYVPETMCIPHFLFFSFSIFLSNSPISLVRLTLPFSPIYWFHSFSFLFVSQSVGDEDRKRQSQNKAPSRCLSSQCPLSCFHLNDNKSLRPSAFSSLFSGASARRPQR